MYGTQKKRVHNRKRNNTVNQRALKDVAVHKVRPSYDATWQTSDHPVYPRTTSASAMKMGGRRDSPSSKNERTVPALTARFKFVDSEVVE